MTLQIENLKLRYGCENYDYYDLRKRVIDPAIKEILEKTGLAIIELEPTKNGKAIHTLHFSVARKRKATNTGLNLLLNRNVTREAAAYICDNFTDQEITDVINQVEQNKGKVNNLAAYIVSIFRNQLSNEKESKPRESATTN